MKPVTFRIWRTQDGAGGRQRRARTGKFVDYTTEISEGMVVLDAVHKIQATQANDLACRWNCKAGKCGSCSAEINGIPKLMCMTRMDTLPTDKPITIEPMRDISEHPRSGDGCFVEFPGQKEDQEIQSAQAGRAGRHLAHGAGGH